MRKLEVRRAHSIGRETIAVPACIPQATAAEYSDLHYHDECKEIEIAGSIAVVLGALWGFVRPLAKERERSLAVAQRIAEVESLPSIPSIHHV
jgi:hypothetical protein